MVVPMKYGKKIKNLKFYALTLGIIVIAVLVQLGLQVLLRH